MRLRNRCQGAMVIKSEGNFGIGRATQKKMIFNGIAYGVWGIMNGSWKPCSNRQGERSHMSRIKNEHHITILPVVYQPLYTTRQD